MRKYEQQKGEVARQNEQNRANRDAVMERNDFIMQERKRQAEEAVKQAAFQIQAAKQEKLSEDGNNESEMTGPPSMLKR